MACGWIVNVCVSMDRYVYGRDTARLYMAQLRKKKRLQGQHAWCSARRFAWLAGPHLQEREREGELCFVLCGTVVDDDWMWECGGEAVWRWARKGAAGVFFEFPFTFVSDCPRHSVSEMIA